MYSPWKKSPFLVLLLSLLTCGIYTYFWYADVTTKRNDYLGENEQSPGMVVLLSTITCGIYTIYWCYVVGKRLVQMQEKAGLRSRDDSLLYVLLILFGLGFFPVILIQNELNKVWDAAS